MFVKDGVDEDMAEEADGREGEANMGKDI